MAVLALAVLVRGVGDVINNSGSALSWLSPIAWAQQMRAFVDLRWWPFALLVVLALGLMVSSAALEGRRQYDARHIPVTGERPNAHADHQCLRAAPDAAAGPDHRLERWVVPGAAWRSGR